MTAQRSRLRLSLSRQILQHILTNAIPVGGHLRETTLAKELGVSRSPVRTALQALADQDILELVRNKGYVLREDPNELAGRVEAFEASEDEALYSDISRDRLTDNLPEKLTEAELMRRYECNRTILRITLNRMAEDGLIKKTQGYGWEFLPVLNSRDAHQEAYRFRKLIEPAALLEPNFTIDEEQLSALRRAHEAVLECAGVGYSPQQLFEMNASFHEALAQWSGNRFFYQAIQQQNRLRRLTEYWGYSSGKSVEISVREHLRILELLETDETEEASQTLSGHLNRAASASDIFT